MDKHDRFIAINQTLPGLEDFLRVVLGSESLSDEANRQRVEFLRRLESVSKPPSLPPRPANFGDVYRSRLQHLNDAVLSGSNAQDEGSPYNNEKPLDPVEFASQQRELSRVANLYKTYAPQTVILGEKGTQYGGLYLPRSGIATNPKDVRDSIQSTSSAEDDIYERLSLKSLSSPSGVASPVDGETDIKNEVSFFPSPPKTPQESTGTGIYVTARPGSFRASAGKGKLSTGWFKKEAKVLEEVYASNLQEPVIQGYLKDTKANKRRWCVLQGNRLHIFKTPEDPAVMIIDLLGCDMGVDDKKKISYSFRLTPKEGPGISLAIEDGQDLSPWMSAIMAAVVRRGSIDRPNSPLDSALTLEKIMAERTHSSEEDGEKAKEVEVEENYYEVPVDHLAGGIPFLHSSPLRLESDDEDDQGYDAPLPSLPIMDDYSSSDSSSDEDESMEKKEPLEKGLAGKKIYDAIPADLLAELTAGKHRVATFTNQSQDSICEDSSANDRSLDFTDSHSEHSGNISNRHSYSEPLASDDTGSSEPKVEKTGSLTRKRTSTVLSASMDSVCSDTDETRRPSVSSEASVNSKGLAPKVKRRRKLVPAEAELQFLQDPAAMHSGILYQKRKLGVWSKRYCKIMESSFKCYRNPADQKPSLELPILGYDINLMDSKESKKSYCIKISHPSHDTHYFATDSRVSIERWIDVLSLASTGRLDVIAPYPPYFCAEQSGDEINSKSQESLLSSEGRLSDDDSVDTLDDLDGPVERNKSRKTSHTSEEQSSLQSADSSMVLSCETSSIQSQTITSEVQQPLENQVIERVQKKRKGKQGDNEGTKTPSTMSPPHSMFISESVDGQAKPEPMDQGHAQRTQTTTKERSEDSTMKKDVRWTETLKRKKLSRALTYDPRLRVNTMSSNLTNPTKNKPQSTRRKHSQTFAHLVNLFDKGRICGNLTEVKYNKFSTTHLRRWCVVKNAVLILYNSECEETPQHKLSLVDMWLTDKSDESRNKFAFSLEDKEGKETILQTTVKEDYQKWLGLLEFFTKQRVESRTLDVAAEPLRKPEFSGSEEGGGNFERGTVRSKSARAASKLKDEKYALAPGKVRSSIRMKLSQRMNVRDIFRKTHDSYDLEGAPTEGQSSELPSTDVNTLAVFGGLLTQVEPTVSGENSAKSRWCTIKEKELLVFSDHKATDPLNKFPLVNSVISNLSNKESNVNRFQVRHGNEKIVFDALDKFDLNRWLRMLASVTEYRNSSDDERPKCSGRLTSPTFARKKIHRRTRSEALQTEDHKPVSTTAQCDTKAKEGSSSATDRLMSGYLQEVREAHGARTVLRRWCVATSDKFSVYNNQDSKKASFEWELSEMQVQDQSDMEAEMFGFCVINGEERLCFRVIDEDSARHWLSVLARYCHALPEDQPVFKTPSRWRSNGRRSSSDNDLKSAAKSNEKERNALKVLSEGRASGQKLFRRATEDSTFFRKFNRSEFRAPWRASSEKLEVKMRERSGKSAANRTWKRFSCGSLFDSEGKYSGYLMELITSALYSSQVRRWCLQKDELLQVFENEASDRPIKVIPLFDAKVLDTSDIDACVYRFRIDYGDNQSVFFRTLTRSDLEKWTTVISVKIAVLQDRSERQLRRIRSLSLEKSTDEFTGSSESDIASPGIYFSKHTAADSIPLQSPISIGSLDSVFIRNNNGEEETSISGSTGLQGDEPIDETNSFPLKSEDEKSTNNESERNAGETTSLEPQNSKRMNRLSSIEDLSHMYENFLAFASVKSEISDPELHEQLYHIYQNVTQAFNKASQGMLPKEEGGVGEKDFASTGNELESPSSEINSGFQKISLLDTEDQHSTYRFGESNLEKHNEVIIGSERSIVETVAEVENESVHGSDLTGGRFTDETDLAVDSHTITLEGEIVNVRQGNIEGLKDNVKCDLDTSWGNSFEREEADVVEKDKENSLDEKYVCETQFELVENIQENVAVKSISQTNSISPSPLAHANCASVLETGATSFYLVQESNDHVWTEIERIDVGEPAIETALAANDGQSSVSIVSESANDGDRRTSGDAEDHEFTLEGIQDGKQDNLSNGDQTCLAAAQASVVDTEDATVSVSSNFVSQLGVSKTTDVHCETESREGQDLGESTSFFMKENFVSLNSGLTEDSSLRSIETNDGGDELRQSNVLETNQTSRAVSCCARALRNVRTAQSFETTLPLVSTCSRKMEVHCEQTVESAVSESEHAQVSHAMTSVHKNKGSEPESFEETLDSNLENEDSTPFVGNSQTQSFVENSSDKAISDCASGEADIKQSSAGSPSELVPESSCAVSTGMDNPSDFSNFVADETQPSDTSCQARTASSQASFSRDQSIDKQRASPELSSESSTKCSSDDNYLTPEDTFEDSEAKSTNTENDFSESNSTLGTSDKDFSTNLERHTLPVDGDSPNMANKAEMTKSQIDILKAVTAAFEEILELHGDESDADETKL